MQDRPDRSKSPCAENFNNVSSNIPSLLNLGKKLTDFQQTDKSSVSSEVPSMDSHKSRDSSDALRTFLCEPFYGFHTPSEVRVLYFRIVPVEGFEPSFPLSGWCYPVLSVRSLFASQTFSHSVTIIAHSPSSTCLALT